MSDDLQKQLPYLVALQPKFREVMGPVQPGDDYAHPSDGYVIKQYTQEMFDQGQILFGRYIRIPLTNNDSSEEARKRSLWGMCDPPRNADSYL
jgi:hypothetical protein